MKPIARWLSLVSLLICIPVSAAEQTSWEEALSNTTAQSGLMTLHVDPDAGRILLEVPPPQDTVSQRVIYQAGLVRGLGSNPVGLDRTFGNGSQIIAIRQVGNRVLFEAENWRFRAEASNAERRAVNESFARSVIWATDIVARHDDGRALIDIADFAVRDAIGIASRLKQVGQGNFNLDSKRSVVESSRALVFPRNIEIAATLTFTSSDPGAEVRQTAPDARSVSLVVQHSFFALPDNDYPVREFDHRVGAIDLSFYDYSSPLTDRLARKLAVRHRLQSVDDQGNVAEPIVFYVDPGAPEPIRSALLEGARWWEEAFEAAGFKDAYRVELLPEDIHPLDGRYNVITWVHRETRGWSYGASVVDPRTGEIVRGYVLLGSQRIRQDRLIFEGLAGRSKTGSGSGDDPLQLALARIRQLSAHEVGHTLGIAHNFAASMDNRASVMDYPAPWVRVTKDDALDFSEAYDVGIGAWDIFTIRWLYGEFDNNEAAQLDALVAQSQRDGLRYVSDSDGRGVGTMHPRASIWDNGGDPVAALEEAWNVRRVALANFDADQIPVGMDQAQLRRILVPIYLYHRYQLNAAAKYLGGADFHYRKRGDDGDDLKVVSAADQRRALDTLVATLDPAGLDLPSSLLALLTPFNSGFAGTDSITRRELFASRTSTLFDPLSAATNAADLTLGALLHPARAARLQEQRRHDPEQLSFDEVLAALDTAILTPPRRQPERLGAIQFVLQERYVHHLTQLADNGSASAQTRAAVKQRLDQHASRLERLGANGRYLATQIRRYQTRQLGPLEPSSPPAIPPGSPIGMAESCWHCEP